MFMYFGYLPVAMLLVSATFFAWRDPDTSDGVFALLLTITLLYFAAGYWYVAFLDREDARRADKAKESMNTRRVNGWIAQFTRHEQLNNNFRSMILDEKMRILYPALLDDTGHLARDVETTQRLADALRPSEPDSSEDVEQTAYYRALNRMDNAIKSFVRDAKNVGWSNLTPHERLEASSALERHYKAQEARNLPLRSRDFSPVM